MSTFAEQQKALRALRTAQLARQKLDCREYMIIAQLRQLGVTWERIALVLNLRGQQGALEHYKSLASRVRADGRRPKPVLLDD
jgi:hypothetical protein